MNNSDKSDIERFVDKFRIALADAIRRPMGVIPDSAAGLLDQDDLDAAEERRTKEPERTPQYEGYAPKPGDKAFSVQICEALDRTHSVTIHAPDALVAANLGLDIYLCVDPSEMPRLGISDDCYEVTGRDVVVTELDESGEESVKELKFYDVNDVVKVIHLEVDDVEEAKKILASFGKRGLERIAEGDPRDYGKEKE